MLPAPLAPLDRRKTRALTTIYAPRLARQHRKNKTAQARAMIDGLPVKPGLSPFNPLPAIKQRQQKETKVIVLDLNKNETFRPATVEERVGIKLQDILKPLTPLRVYGRVRSDSLDRIEVRKPQQLLRENTYDVIEPIFLTAPKIKKRELSRRHSPIVVNSENLEKRSPDPQKPSARSRFKKAALEVAKLSSVPETGKLLCLRERDTLKMVQDDEDFYKPKECLESPSHRLDKVTEIFQGLDLKGHHRDRVKKENSWF